MRRKKAFPALLIPLFLATVLTMAAAGGCAGPEDKAWDSFSKIMDSAFGQGKWTAESHDFADGTLTVKGVRTPVPPRVAAYLKAKADASARTQAAFEAKSAQELADAEAARKINAERAERRAAEEAGEAVPDDPQTPAAGDAPASGDTDASGSPAQSGDGAPDAQAPAGSGDTVSAPSAPSAGDADAAPAPEGGGVTSGNTDADAAAAGTAAIGEESSDTAADAGSAGSSGASTASDAAAAGSAGADTASDGDSAGSSDTASDGDSAASSDTEAGAADGAVTGAPAPDAASGEAGAAAEARPASGEAAPATAADDDPNAPTAENPGISVKSVKISGLAAAEALPALLQNSGDPLEVFASMEIEGLHVHTGASSELGSAEILVPMTVLTGLSCRPGGAKEGGTPAPACTLARISSGEGYGFGFIFLYPEADFRLSLRMDASSYAADNVSLGGDAGLALSGIKAARFQAANFDLALGARQGLLTAGVSIGLIASEGLDGAYSAQHTRLTEIEVFVLGNEPDPMWLGTAESLTAVALDVREALSGDGARPGAYFLNEFLGAEGGGLVEALWPGWDCVLSQRYSAGSWRLDGFRGSGPDGDRLEFRSVEATGPMLRGKLASTTLEMRGMVLEFPSDVWFPEYQQKTAEFLGTNIIRGDVTVWKTYDPQNSVVHWRLDSLDLRDLGRLYLKVDFTGVKDSTLAALSEIRLRNIDRIIAAIAAHDLGIGNTEIALSAQPAMDRLVIRTAEEKETLPSAALSEMTSNVSMTLLYFLSNYASVESVMAVTDSLVDFMKKPQALTVTLEPSSPLNAVAFGNGMKDLSTLVELLNINVTANERLPVALEP
ncbi:MAG: hypothetical protein LBT40_02535 [Deltaproteobacteria bacterium]|jgi:hypothetical protein|nr:hypothetical protein [Deltaproteobacteria bacterium]